MPIYVLGRDKGFVLGDKRVEDNPDDDMAPALLEMERHIREKFPGMRFMLMVQKGERSHYLAGEAAGPLPRHIGVRMAERLRHLFTTGR